MPQKPRQSFDYTLTVATPMQHVPLQPTDRETERVTKRVKENERERERRGHVSLFRNPFTGSTTKILRLPQGQRPFHLSSAIGHLCCRNSIDCKSSHACFAPRPKWPLRLTSATYSQDQHGTSLPGLVHTFNPVAHWFASGPVARSNAPFLSEHYTTSETTGTGLSRDLSYN